MKVDAPTLASICQKCFALSTNGDVPDKQRQQFLLYGKELRGDLLNLITATFDDDTQKVTDANANLAAVNNNLDTASASLENAVATVKEIATIAKTLDQLMKIAAGFV